MASNELVVNGVEVGGSFRIPTDDPIRQYRVTYAEALRLINASVGRTFYVYTYQEAPSVAEDNVIYPVCNNVETTRAGVLRFLDGAYTKSIRDKAGVRVSICSNCFFIG